jgi:NifU-like protein involved in Fe-S cluster formation
MSDRDLLELYSGRILQLASSIPNSGRLPAPQGAARRRAPLCGSTIGAEVVLRDGRLAEYAQDVRACALGQAAASVVGAAAPGRSLAEVRAARESLRAMLQDGAPAPDAPFDGLAVLIPARGHANRHGSILLSLDALIEAMEAAEARS